MYQAATPIWNQIAATQPLRTDWAKLLFAMSPEELTAELEAQATFLERRGIPIPVILAYQTFAPLLAENQAISRYIVQTENLALRRALPEVVSVAEALVLASLEYSLNQRQCGMLSELLQPLSP